MSKVKVINYVKVIPSLNYKHLTYIGKREESLRLKGILVYYLSFIYWSFSTFFNYNYRDVFNIQFIFWDCFKGIFVTVFLYTI